MKMIVVFALVLTALTASGKVIFKKAGETVVLDCGLEGSGSLKWTRENDLLFSVLKLGSYPSKGKSFIQSRCLLRDINLEVQRVSQGDAGTFKCKLGQQEQQITLVVFSVSASPSQVLLLASQATLHCNVNPKMAVQWLRPDGGVHSESAEVNLNPVAQRDAGTWKCTFTFKSERHTEPLEVTVTASRPTTPSPPSRISGNVNVLNGEADSDKPTYPPKMAPLGIALWMWAAIGGGSLVVALLLAILISCMCRRVRRRRRLARKMKNGHQLRTPLQYCQCDGPTAAARPQQRRQRAKPSAPPLQTLLVE